MEREEEIREAVRQHLEGMCQGPCEIAVGEMREIGEGAVMAEFEFDGEAQAAVYYPQDDALFTPRDWQGFAPAGPEEIGECQWVNSAGDEALVMNGLPRTFLAVRSDARKALGAKVAGMREAAGLSQAELAKAAGLGQSNVARIESGRYNVTLDTIARLQAALGEII